MIRLHCGDGTEYWVSVDKIVCMRKVEGGEIEVSLVDGTKVYAWETAEQIVSAIEEQRRLR